MVYILFHEFSAHWNLPSEQPAFSPDFPELQANYQKVVKKVRKQSRNILLGAF